MTDILGRIAKVAAAAVLAVAMAGCDCIDHAADKAEQKLDECDPMQKLDEGPPQSRGPATPAEVGPMAVRSTPRQNDAGTAEAK